MFFLKAGWRANVRNYKASKKNDSIADHKEFPGRNHFVRGHPTWKEDADYILDWLNNHLRQTTGAHGLFRMAIGPFR